MPLLKPLFSLSEICSMHGIEDAVICPGSRSAALTLAFARNPSIKTRVLGDERSAAFVALGMALASKKTVALICTSGSAALNFSPAIAEAFFQEVPLLILTADRPPEWIHQYDGQTIFQNEIYGKHVKKSYTLPADYSHPDSQWQIERSVNEAIIVSQSFPKGPVHINVPIREPFYPDTDETFEFKSNSRIIVNCEVEKNLTNAAWASLLDIWEDSENRLIAVGQQSDDLNDALRHIEGAVVLADVISNVNTEKAIHGQDMFLAKADQDLKPDLLITVGKSFISKSFKQYIRKNKPKYHWHIQQHSDIIDPLQSISQKIEIDPKVFFNTLADVLDRRKSLIDDEEEENEYELLWSKDDNRAKAQLASFLHKEIYGELLATALLFEKLPQNSIIHLGNSMPVRYANLIFGLIQSKNMVCCNRGTSGIDGILSTAIGHAHKTNEMVTCLIGDMSFFYDINALWSSEIPSNLRIVIINNAGGNIFRIIDGPNNQPELEEYFVTHQTNNAQSIANELGIIYINAENTESLKNAFVDFYDSSRSIKIMEVFTNGTSDSSILKELKAGFN